MNEFLPYKTGKLYTFHTKPTYIYSAMSIKKAPIQRLFLQQSRLTHEQHYQISESTLSLNLG